MPASSRSRTCPRRHWTTAAADPFNLFCGGGGDDLVLGCFGGGFAGKEVGTWEMGEGRGASAGKLRDSIVSMRRSGFRFFNYGCV